MKPSIIYSCIRSFFVTFSTMVAIAFGIVPIIIVLALFAMAPEELKIEDNYKPEIVANAKGVRKKLSSSAPVILKLNIQGVSGLDGLTTAKIRQQLEESRSGALKDNRVKAVLLHVNTPGGAVSDSNGIYSAIQEYKKRYKVPVYAYVDGLCASGGMYVTCSCDKVLASDISVVGSVGVLSPTFFNVSQLMDKVGVESLTITAGKGKDAMNPFRPWKKGEQDDLNTVIQSLYHHFVTLVTENHPRLDKEKLIKDYGAHVFVANKAQELGYIDESNATLGGTIAALAKKAGLQEDKYQVVEMESKSWYRELLNNRSPLFTGKVEHSVAGFPELAPELRNQYLYLYCPE